MLTPCNRWTMLTYRNLIIQRQQGTWHNKINAIRHQNVQIDHRHRRHWKANEGVNNIGFDRGNMTIPQLVSYCHSGCHYDMLMKLEISTICRHVFCSCSPWVFLLHSEYVTTRWNCVIIRVTLYQNAASNVKHILWMKLVDARTHICQVQTIQRETIASVSFCVILL